MEQVQRELPEGGPHMGQVTVKVIYHTTCKRLHGFNIDAASRAEILGSLEARARQESKAVAPTGTGNGLTYKSI